MLTRPKLQFQPPDINQDVTRPLKSQQHSVKPARRQIILGMTGFQCLPLSNFKYFLTLFSKFFSSFPHGTCSLSVSRQYLALDEIYHPFRTAFPSNSTLGTDLVRGDLQVKDGI